MGLAPVELAQVDGLAVVRVLPTLHVARRPAVHGHRAVGVGHRYSSADGCACSIVGIVRSCRAWVCSVFDHAMAASNATHRLVHREHGFEHDYKKKMPEM